MATKTRQIEYHLLKKKALRRDSYSPFLEIESLLDFMIELPQEDKMFQLKNYKSCCLKSIIKSEDNNGNKIICGYFKSAVAAFRPDVMDIRTGDERNNPKTFHEGDGEKTHFCIKIIVDEDNENYVVYLALERNGNGVSINHIINCFKGYNTRRLEAIGENRSYTLIYETIIRQDYMEVLNNLASATNIEVYFNKRLVGNEALDFSNRVGTVRDDVKMIISAKPKTSIKSTAVDVIRKFTHGNVQISKVRIKGVDDENHNVLIDTNLMSDKREIQLELNPDTGEIITQGMYTALKHIVEDFD